MFSFILPFLSYLLKLLLAQIPPDTDLGDELVELVLFVLGKAVKLSTTDVDDKLFETVAAALKCGTTCSAE